MVIDTISVMRFNDALGYKNAVGAVFGQRDVIGSLSRLRKKQQ
jgi:hypothetical protein